MIYYVENESIIFRYLNKVMKVYNKTRWRKVSLSYLQQNPFCVICREQGRYEPATAVDHIIPHKLNRH